MLLVSGMLKGCSQFDDTCDGMKRTLVSSMWSICVLCATVLTFRDSIDGVQGAQHEDSTGKVQVCLEGDNKERTGFEVKRRSIKA